MKTWSLTVVGEAFVTAMRLSITGKENLCRMCYLTVLNVQKETENVDARTRTLQDRVSSAHASFKLETSEWSLDPTATLSASAGSISSQKEIRCH